MLKDRVFETWLDEVGPLDAVTLWFSGVHKARGDTELVQMFEIGSDSEHREVLEDLVIQLAGRRLRPGGLLQIVGRGAGDDLEQLRNEFGMALADALGGHPFEVVSVNGRHYTEPKSGNAIVLASKTVPAGGAPAAFSFIARRV